METMNANAAYIEIHVGNLPTWYDDKNSNRELEALLERRWRSNPACADADFRICHNYQGPTLVVATDDKGDTVFELETDIDDVYAELLLQEVQAVVETDPEPWNETSLADWLAGGSYTEGDTILSIAAEWDELQRQGDSGDVTAEAVLDDGRPAVVSVAW